MIKYIKIRGNQTDPIEISQIAVLDQTGKNLCLGLGESSFTVLNTVTPNPTVVNMVDGFFASKSKTYLATSPSESILIDLGLDNKDIVFIVLYLGLSDKINMIGAQIDLIDSNNIVIKTRKIQNIIDLYSVQYVLFDFDLVKRKT